MRRLRFALPALVGVALIASLGFVQTLIDGNQIRSHTVTALQLDTPGVTAGTYGDATHVGQFTVAADGRLTSAANVTVTGGGGTAVAASAWNSTSQTLTSGTEAALSFDSTDYDASAMHSAGNPTRLTVPTGDGGIYRVTCGVKFTTALAGAVHLRFYKDGSLFTENTASGADLSSTNEYHKAVTDIQLAAADYVECKALVELSAGSGTIATASGSGNTMLQAAGIIAGAPFSALTLLEQHTASSSATLDFTSAITSTYDEYQIELLNVLPATNNVTLEMLCSTNGGSTYDTSALYVASVLEFNSTGSATVGQAIGSPTTALWLTASGNVQTTSTYGVVGHLRLYSPGSANHKLLTGELLYNATVLQRIVLGGEYQSTTAVNAIRFLFSSGNIASGTIRIYGVSKS